MVFQNYDFHSFELSIHARLEGVKILCLFNDGIDILLIYFEFWATVIDIMDI